MDVYNQIKDKHMNSPFKYSFDNKRYHSLAYENKLLGKKVYKAVIDAGFTCPNIDGIKGTGGCIYCAGGSGYFTSDSSMSVTKQIGEERRRILKKYPDAELCAYFQAHTNTYKPVNELKTMYNEALSCYGVTALAIATRPDAVSSATMDLIAELSGKTRLTVELGLQTVHDETAKRINRCYNFDDFLRCYKKLKENDIRVCIHLINGLPGENEEMMISTAKTVGELCPDALKIHLLYVIENTPLADMYKAGDYEPMTLETYTDTVVSQLEYIPAETVVERLTGDGDKNTLISPLWSRDKIRVLGTIDKKFFQRDTWQGKKLGNQ